MGGRSPPFSQEPDRAPERSPRIEPDERKLIRRFLTGSEVYITDPKMSDAIFLHQHPTWSAADLDATDQDLIDILSALDAEGAKIARRQQAKADAAAHRSR